MGVRRFQAAEICKTLNPLNSQFMRECFITVHFQPVKILVLILGRHQIKKKKKASESLGTYETNCLTIYRRKRRCKTSTNTYAQNDLSFCPHYILLLH